MKYIHAGKICKYLNINVWARLLKYFLLIKTFYYTHIYIYIYVCMCVCVCGGEGVCVCVYIWMRCCFFSKSHFHWSVNSSIKSLFLIRILIWQKVDSISKIIIIITYIIKFTELISLVYFNIDVITLSYTINMSLGWECFAS